MIPQHPKDRFGALVRPNEHVAYVTTQYKQGHLKTGRVDGEARPTRGGTDWLVTIKPDHKGGRSVEKLVSEIVVIP